MKRIFLGAMLAGLAMLQVTLPVHAEDEAAAKPGVVKPDAAQTAQWKKQIAEWRRWFLAEKLDPERSPDLAREKIAALDDAAAVPALIAALKTEKNPRFRLVLVEPLISLGGKDAVAFLVKLSVEDENPTLREKVCAGLADQPELPGHLDDYIAYLKVPKLAGNAAEALLGTKLIRTDSIGQQQQPDPKLAGALINALNAYEDKVMPYRIAHDTGFLPHVTANPGVGVAGGFQSRGYEDRLVKVKVPVPNEKVLKTLQEYTGQDYQYSESAWKEWLSDGN